MIRNTVPRGVCVCVLRMCWRWGRRCGDWRQIFLEENVKTAQSLNKGMMNEGIEWFASTSHEDLALTIWIMALLIPVFLMASPRTVRQNVLGGKRQRSEIRPIIVETLQRLLCFTLLKGTWHTVGPRGVYTRFTGSKGHMDSSVSFPFFFLSSRSIPLNWVISGPVSQDASPWAKGWSHESGCYFLLPRSSKLLCFLLGAWYISFDLISYHMPF